MHATFFLVGHALRIRTVFLLKPNPDPAFNHVNDGWISHVSCALLQKFVTNFVLLYLTYDANVNPVCYENSEKFVTKDPASVQSQKNTNNSCLRATIRRCPSDFLKKKNSF